MAATTSGQELASRKIARRVVRAALFGVLALASPGFSRLAWAATMRHETTVITTASGKTNISTEVAVSSTEQEQGLMFRTSIGDNDGMLFVYAKPQAIQMWMRNTYIPLDMVFIQPDGTVSRIETGAEPLSERIIPSGPAAKAVLELKAGTALRLGLKPGDHIESPAINAAP